MLDIDLSKRINVVRFLLIVLICFTHNTVEEVRFFGAKEIIFMPEYVNIIQNLFAKVIASSAVPLFTIISSYLLYSKETKFTNVLKKKSKTILLPYFLWTVLVLLLYVLGPNIPGAKQFFPQNMVADFTLIDWIDQFVGKFTAIRENSPLVYQFHFLRDLYILSLLFLAIKKIADKFPFATITLFFIIWLSDIYAYLVAPRMLFFFTLGYYIVKYKWDYRKLDEIKIYDVFFIYVITVAIRLFFYEKMPVIFHINVLVGVILFIKLTKYFIENEKIYKTLAGLSKYAFFVFATHGIALAIALKLWAKILPMHGIWLLLHYFAGVIFVLAILVLIAAILRKISPKIYAVLTGNRINF